MNFIQFPSIRTDRLRPPGRCTVAIALIQLPIFLTAHPAAAKSAATTPATPHVQTIALKSAEAEPPTIATNPNSDFRLLGYGLFLLQIGLIPLKFAKGNKVQTID
jgi:hypothetical protein